ncbi:MAG: hypothetical protein JO086_08390 [Acidimicrobiia bacterium]|nr:hypothetical protein [Acidimicrobiia bacterium]
MSHVWSDEQQTPVGPEPTGGGAGQTPTGGTAAGEVGSGNTGTCPALTEGSELIGEFEGSGYKEPPSLVRRGDGQVIQLTPLLYSVAERADGNHTVDQIAKEVGQEIGRSVSAENVRTLVDKKLYPLGLVTSCDGSEPDVDKPDPLLGLKFRLGVIPERASHRLGGVFKPLFFPPIILGALGVLVGSDYWLFFHHGIAQATRQALYEPAVFLLMFAALILSAAFHEIGHASGCRYGGAEPGRMGCGLYLAWPAFFTDVTDAYRLSRRGRLRTDLGGVYFNVIVICITMAVYLTTRWEPLLLLVVVEHVEIVHQLLPVIRLDGYYIVADLTGVPDLFARIKPILASALPWKKADDRVRVLRPWVRVAVTAWVLIVIPALALQLGIVLIQLPRILGTAWDSLGKQLHTVTHAASPLTATTAAVEIVALALPILGILLMLVRVAQRSAVWVWTHTEGKPVRRTLALVLFAGVCGLLLYVWIPKGNYSPIRHNERGTIQQGVLALNPKNVSNLKPLTPPPDLSSHLDDTPKTTTPKTTQLPPAVQTTSTTARYRSYTTTTLSSTYRTPTTVSRYTTQTTYSSYSSPSQ